MTYRVKKLAPTGAYHVQAIPNWDPFLAPDTSPCAIFSWTP